MSTKAGPLILYVGKDLGYFKALEQRYNHMLSGDTIKYQSILECLSAEDVNRTYLKILANPPNIIYVDFSTHLGQHRRLAQMIRRDNSTKHIPVVGLVEHQRTVRDCRASGVQFVHIKCGEFHDVVFDPAYLAFPAKAKPQAFAKARANIEVSLIEDFRVGFFAKDYMHVEGNLRLEVGNKIKLESNIPNDILPSKSFVVREVSDQNLYYDYTYATNLNYVFLDAPELNEDQIADGLGEEDEAKKQKLIAEAKAKHREAQAEFTDKLKRTIKKFNAWIDDNHERSTPKETKILIIDPLLSFLKDNKNELDSFPYTLRFQTQLGAELIEIERHLPNIVAIQFLDHSSLTQLDEAKSKMDLLEYEKEREQLVTKLEDEAVQNLAEVFKKITTISGYTPIVIIFGCENYTSKAFQESFKYPLVMTHKHNFKLAEVTEMAKLFENKQKEKFEKATLAKIAELKKMDPIKNGRLNLSDFVERRYHISKNSELSFASFARPAILDGLSESEVTIITEEDLHMGIYRLDRPIAFSVTLVPFADGKNFESSGGKLRRYKGLIHSVGEDEKKELRRYVNEVFGTPKKEKEIKEKLAFEALNEKKASEREELVAAREREAQKELEEKLSKTKIE